MWFFFAENKRRKYDLYGSEDAAGQGHNGFNGFPAGFGRMPGDDVFSQFYKFRDPEDVFKEFFQNDLFMPFGPSPFHPQNGNGNGHNNAFSPFGFGNLQPFVQPFGNLGFSSFTTFSSNDVFGMPNGGVTNGNGAPAPKSNVKRTTTSTKYVNGKKIETRK